VAVHSGLECEWFAAFGEPQQPFAPTDKQLHAQLIFQILDVLAHPGLRSDQGVGNLGQVEVTANGFLHNTKLLEIYGDVSDSNERFRAGR